MAAQDQNTRPKMQNFLVVAITLLAASSGMVSLARQVTEFGPQVGDIVAFDPARQSGFDSDARLTTSRGGRSECVLDIRVMRRSGGSIVLEQRDASPERLYRAHWSGTRTSEESATDCGTDADLSLSRADLGALAAAAGGFGADPASTLRLR